MKEHIDLELAAGDLSSILSLMKTYGSSVILNWGEDNDAWECSWITDGKRYTDFSRNAEMAARRVLMKVRGAMA